MTPLQMGAIGFMLFVMGTISELSTWVRREKEESVILELYICSVLCFAAAIVMDITT